MKTFEHLDKPWEEFKQGDILSRKGWTKRFIFRRLLYCSKQEIAICECRSMGVGIEDSLGNDYCLYDNGNGKSYWNELEDL